MVKRYFLILPLVLLLVGCTGKNETDRIEVYDKKTNEHIQTIKDQKIVNQFIKEIKNSEGIAFFEELTYDYRIEIYQNNKKVGFDYTFYGGRPSVALNGNAYDIDYFIPEKYFTDAEKNTLNANIFFLKTKLPIEESVY